MKKMSTKKGKAKPSVFDDPLVATKSQWESLLHLLDDLKAEKRLLKELLDEANQERYAREADRDG